MPGTRISPVPNSSSRFWSTPFATFPDKSLQFLNRIHRHPSRDVRMNQAAPSEAVEGCGIASQTRGGFGPPDLNPIVGWRLLRVGLLPELRQYTGDCSCRVPCLA
jgi:hypothetical protein